MLAAAIGIDAITKRNVVLSLWLIRLREASAKNSVGMRRVVLGELLVVFELFEVGFGHDRLEAIRGLDLSATGR